MSAAPLLFQRRFRTENRAISHGIVRKVLQAALAETCLVDAGDGDPLNYTPHDFRRILITDAVMNGLPPHIAQVIAGHRDIPGRTLRFSPDVEACVPARNSRFPPMSNGRSSWGTSRSQGLHRAMRASVFHPVYS
jgi:hypothetical protein